LKTNQERVLKKFQISAELISNLSKSEEHLGTKVDLPDNDPIAQALGKLKQEMQNLKREEEKRAWISQGLAKFSEILRQKGEVKEYSQRIIGQLVKYVGANQGGFYIEYKSEDGQRYMQLTGCYAYEKKKFVDGKVMEGEGLLGQCMLEKDVVFVTEVPKDYVKITSGLGHATPRNIVVVPLIFNEVFYGAIELALFEVMKPHELEFLKRVCENIASEVASLKNMDATNRLLTESNHLTQELQSREEEMKQNLEELAATQEEMARKQAELSGVINAIDSTLATAEFNVQGGLVKHNDLLTKIFGFSESQFCEKDFRLITGMESDISFRQVLNGEVSGGDFYTKCCSGQSVWLSTTFTVVHDNQGNPTAVLALVQDITAKKEQEQEFERLSLVANNTDNSVIITDANGITEYVNDGFTKMTGFQASEIIGKKPGKLLQGEDTDQQTIQRIRKKVKLGEPIYEEILNYRKDGQPYWVSIAINPVLNDAGMVDKFISIQANITATKNASLDFRYKLEAISRSNAIVEFDTKGVILDANENFLRLTEYTLDEIKGKHHRIFMPENEAEGREYEFFWEQLGRGELINDEFARVTKTGKKIWLKGIYNPIFDMYGKPKRIVKFAVDITEEKRLEELAQRKEKELNSYLKGINNTIASVVFTPAGEFVSGNEIFMKVMGYQSTDVVGRHFDFFMGDDTAVVMMWENLRLGKFFSGEFKMKDKQRKDLYLTGTFNPIIIDGTTPQNVMMFAQFITQEKEKLNELNTMVHALKSTLPVLELNEQFVCKSANERLLKLFGLSRLEIRSKSILDFIDPYYHVVWNSKVADILAQDFVSIKLPINRGGRMVTYETSISMSRNLEGQVSRIVLLLVRELEENVAVMAAV
jgi:PAS domain S-box-containing protein